MMRTNYRNVYRTWLLGIAFTGIICSLAPQKAAAGDGGDSAKKDVNIALTPLKKQDGSREISVKVWRKEGRRNIQVDGVLINLYANNTTQEGLMGSMLTDDDGIAEFLLTDRFRSLTDSLREYTFIAQLSDDPRYEDADETITIKDASLKLELLEADSVRYASALLTYTDSTGNPVPIADAEIHFSIKRMFSLWPFGGSYTYTDEDGRVQVEFPDDLPGDENGHLTVVVRLEDDEDYGNLEASEIRDWGLYREKSHVLDERQLWSVGANAPVILVVTSVSIIGVIWGILLYLVHQLYRVKKLGREDTIHEIA